MSLCLIVDKSLAETFRKELRRLRLLDSGRKIRKIDEKIAIPILRHPDSEELEKFKSMGGFEVSQVKLDRALARPKTLIEALSGKLAPAELSFLPRSFDVVGDVAIIELPDELLHAKHLIGEALLSINRNIRSVYIKHGKVNGLYRIRPLEHAAGELKTETVHREYGCSFMVDVSKVYFSPRLSWEHWRVASQVRDGEVVIDMFAGVGPFSIMVAKRVGNVKVYAIDLNPVAINYLKKNTELNKVHGKVEPLLGDAREVIRSRLAGVADRVIMNLPGSSINFVSSACEAIKKTGGVIHLYSFAEGGDPAMDVEQRLSYEVSANKRAIRKILFKRVVRSVAPKTWLVAVDALIS